MEKTDYKHYFRTSWTTQTRFSRRHYNREFPTLDEAVAKARKVHDTNPCAERIFVCEEETWNTPEPAPNGTIHIHVLQWNMDWWTGFLPWYELN